jgi:hypothetical protein
MSEESEFDLEIDSIIEAIKKKPRWIQTEGHRYCRPN